MFADITNQLCMCLLFCYVCVRGRVVCDVYFGFDFAAVGLFFSEFQHQNEDFRFQQVAENELEAWSNCVSCQKSPDEGRPVEQINLEKARPIGLYFVYQEFQMTEIFVYVI